MSQGLNPTDHRHGTVNGYINLECRCQRCKAAHAEYQRSEPIKKARASYGHQRLEAYKWVRTHRPDVWEAIKNGADASDFGTDGGPDVVRELVRRVWGDTARIFVQAPEEPTKDDW